MRPALPLPPAAAAVALVSCLAVLACAEPGAGTTTTFNVLSYGAVGDGSTYDTEAIRSTFAAASAAGGGTVLFPPGHTFLTGAFNLSAHTVVRVEGTILGSPNATDYVLVEPLPWYGPDPTADPTDPREWGALVSAYYVDNVTLTGGGVIDGNGWLWWPCAGNTSAPPCSGHVRPHGVRLIGSVGVHIHNLTIQNSPMWQTHLAYVTDAHIHDVVITAPSSSDRTHPAHNTDGIDPDCAQNVLIERVYISTGDDCIAIKSGRDGAGRAFGRPSANITVRDSVFGAGHGLSIGSEMSGGVANVTFANLLANGTGTGIRLKSQRGRGGAITNITYVNITLLNIGGEAVQVTLNYSPGVPPTNATATPEVDGVVLRNVTAVNPKVGWLLDGLPESPLRNLVLDGVSIVGAGQLVAGCDNVASGSCTNVLPSCPPCVPGGGGRGALQLTPGTKRARFPRTSVVPI